MIHVYDIITLTADKTVIAAPNIVTIHAINIIRFNPILSTVIPKNNNETELGHEYNDVVRL